MPDIMISTLFIMAMVCFAFVIMGALAHVLEKIFGEPDDEDTHG